jgi:hypothetical protein
MTLFEAIEAAKAGKVIRRAIHSEGVEIFWRNETLYWNNPESDIWEKPLWAIRTSGILANDWTAE